EAGNGEALAVAHLDRGRGLAAPERGHLEAVVVEAERRVDARDRRLQFKVDDVAIHNPWYELEFDAEGLVFDGNLAVRADHRDRILAAGEEAGFLAGKGGQVRLG